MTSSFQLGIWKLLPPQSKFGSWTTAFPTEFVTSRAYGSMRVNSPVGVVRWKRYSSPTLAPGTSTYQMPESVSFVIGWVDLFHSLNVPTTESFSAWGAQTRKATPA